MQGVNNLRRYCLLMAYDARLRGEAGLEWALRGRQQETAGTALVTSWPSYAQLIAAGYTTREDLDGADSRELITLARLNRAQAEAAIARLSEEDEPMTSGTGYFMADGSYADTEAVSIFGTTALGSAQALSASWEMGERTTLRLALAVSVKSGTNPTLDVTVQTSHDGAKSWRSLGAFDQKTDVLLAMGAVTAAGTTPPTVTLTSTAANRYVNLRVECTTLGARGTAVVRYSTDGGVTWVSGVTTAATITVYDSTDGLGATDTGVVINYASATAAVDNVWTAKTAGFQEKTFSGCDRFVRAVSVVGGTSTPIMTASLTGEAA